MRKQMHRRQFLSWLATTSAWSLASCTTSEVERVVLAAESLRGGKIPNEVSDKIPSTGVEVIDDLARQKLSKLLSKVFPIWNDRKTASTKEYVKYGDNYKSRAIVNFETGLIAVEVLVSENPRAALAKATVATLLTPEDPATVDLLSDKAISYNGRPFLYGLVLDQNNLPVQYQWRANRYADYLMNNAYRTRNVTNKVVHYVTFSMRDNHQNNQRLKYQSYVTTQANRFNLQTSLINSIIEVESAFNPFAVSPAPAYGLMQIVPTSAGRDAFRLLHKRDGIPSKESLFQADKNIEMGSAYLHILFERYLVKVKHPASREYCAIAAYNTGSGNVLKAFHKDRNRAFSKINSLSSQQIYAHLRANLKYQEARNYLQKVITAKQKYI